MMTLLRGRLGAAFDELRHYSVRQKFQARRYSPASPTYSAATTRPGRRLSAVLRPLRAQHQSGPRLENPSARVALRHTLRQA